MKLGEKAMLGHRIRRFRTDMGLNQKEMAAELGISSSYLNLIEHNQRPVTVPLLFRLGQSFDVDLQNFAEDDSARLMAELSEIFADSVFAKHQVSRNEIRDMVSAVPGVATAVCELHTAYRQMWDAMQTALGDDEGRASVPPIGGSPLEEVRGYQEKAGNYFPEIEDAADTFCSEAKLDRDDPFGGIARWLAAQHQISVKIMPVSVMGNQLRRFDKHRSRILLSEALRMPQRIFQLCCQIAFLEHPDLLDRLAAPILEKDAESGTLIRIMLASYFAGAVMMPYDEFLAAARDLRHDVDLLSRRFGAGFEQICHRLTTLQRAGARGIPFFFIRIDNAGNVSKRLSAGGMQFAKFGGTCPRWGVHETFRAPGIIHTQISALADDQRYFTIARTLEPRWTPPGEPVPNFAVALGCELRHAKDIVYADGMNLSKPERITNVGLSCRMCERTDCSQRAYAPLNRRLRFDANIRRSIMFELDE